MSTTSKHLLSALATAAFAVAATATTVTNAFAQTEKKVEQPQGKTRAEVQAEYLEARKNGTLIETEADMDVAQTRKHIVKH
ncbi:MULTISPECIES: DUF4148 domain-containing protein [unclassified Duganella]|jgi:hypothetical protein|uniref:DUF4148 domain-containing protein n=1 Tax=unclassified Duganella TaxID=2636909 RepID=UPI00088ACF60|nr:MULTISPECIES: DUF4148 domain-containing protein [unclassified Duganella]SDH34323.1 protein of unknown function [Duganella sp. OV458]SDK50909.1 protein of unknown function [Duganella sp. OV510]